MTTQKSVAKGMDAVIKARLAPRRERIATLQKMLREAETSGDRQGAGCLSAQITQAELAKEREEADLQAVAIAAASEPAISRVLNGRSIAGSSDPRSALRAILSGRYQRESLPVDQTMLPSQRRIIDAESGRRAPSRFDGAGLSDPITELEHRLTKATDPGERAQLSYQLTRARLVDGHRRGEI